MKQIVYIPTFFKRNQRVLCVFGDKPFWIVGDQSLTSIISFFQGTINYGDLKNRLEQVYSYTESEVAEVVKSIESIFDSAGLFVFPTSDRLNPTEVANNPPNPVINVTRRCNLKCTHCYADANNGQKACNELGTDELKMVIQKVLNWADSKQYDRRVLLSGGEPFIREDIVDLIQFIADNNGEPFVNTNSLLIKETDMDILAKCKAELLVSLDGANATSHEKIRGKGTFKPTIEKVKALLRHGVTTKLSITIHRDNLCELDDFVDLAVKLDVAQVAINPLNILSRAEESNLHRVNLTDFYNALSSIAKKSPKHMYYIERTDYANVGAILLMNVKFQYCGVGAASLVIDYDGAIYPCYNTMTKELLLGNIQHDDLDDIWKNSCVLHGLRELNINSFSSDCQKCPVKYYCGGGCRGEAYYANGSFLSKCPYCADMKSSIIEMMFQLSAQDNDLFQNRIQFFQNQKYIFSSRREHI